ncbi:MAG: hypothetical protein A3D33_14780 [Candidatus Rokubacteria bacterium RIFCSPHIGHO2_02_FULL_73_26]|nr:MAG: hypothetical protein A3D33_14780 [Candidatus Rokubacteria bacterium RIFCSPHIGHO2_02_FULL_73_26]
MPRLPSARHALHALAAAALSVTLGPAAAQADGLLEALSGSEEITYSLLSSKTTDAAGTTTKIRTNNYGSRSHMRLNYNLLPQLNLNAGGTFQKNLSEFSGGTDTIETEVTRIRPYVWLTLRDPVIGAAVGYDRADDTTKTSGQDSVTLTRETYNAGLTWRPLELPATQARYTRTSTRDDERILLDAEQDLFFLKSEYTYRGFNASYAGNYQTTRDNLRDLESAVTSHEGKVVYAGTFLDGRIALATDHRIRATEITTDRRGGLAGLDGTSGLQVPAVLPGLSAISNTISPLALAPDPALDGDRTTSTGLSIGFVGGVPTLRQVGLNFGTAVAVNSLRVWVAGYGTGPLPADVASSFSWGIHTSADGTTWVPHPSVPTVAPAGFGPFDQRFVIAFPSVTTQYIKVVTLPLPTSPFGSTGFSLPIVITEVEAFIDRTVAGARTGTKQTISQTVRTHTLEVKTLLLRLPSLYHRVNAEYQEFQPDGAERYNLSNGLFLTHRFNPVFATSASTSVELGREQEETRTAVLYYASLTATPLRTLTDSLVVSGNRQWVGPTATTSDSAVLYNTAQLYRGIDATLNLGAVLTSDEQGDGSLTRRREYFVNAGSGLTPHRSLSLTVYYLGKLTSSSGGTTGESRDTTENRLDLALSFTPFRTLSVSASADVQSQTDQDTRVTQNYGLSWAPFPDGSLQFSFFYAENRLTEGPTSRIVQPGVRWYLSGRRRSYLEATYQLNTSQSSTLKSESQLFSTSLILFY